MSACNTCAAQQFRSIDAVIRIQRHAGSDLNGDICIIDCDSGSQHRLEFEDALLGLLQVGLWHDHYKLLMVQMAEQFAVTQLSA
jgi:hypothetical protein